MGLDVTASSKIKKANKNNYTILINKGDESFFERCDDVENGYYHYDGEVFEFRAGSYSGYNFFRSILSMGILGVEPEIVWNNDEKYQKEPFYELINFSDCEGYFGPIVSQKLYTDFNNNREKFSTFLNERFGFDKFSVESYLKTYDNFTRGFLITSNGGILGFH